MLAVSFTIEHALHDSGEPQRASATAVASGDCLVSDGNALELGLSELIIEWTEPNGSAGRSRTAFVSATGGVSGERHESYSVRKEIFPESGGHAP